MQGRSHRPARTGRGCLSAFPYAWCFQFHFYPEAGPLLPSRRYDYFAKPPGLQRAAIQEQEIPVEIIGRWWRDLGAQCFVDRLSAVSSSNVCPLLRALNFRRTTSSFGGGSRTWIHPRFPYTVVGQPFGPASPAQGLTRRVLPTRGCTGPRGAVPVEAKAPSLSALCGRARRTRLGPAAYPPLLTARVTLR